MNQEMKNPILTGFHADPCLCRKGDDYYHAVSSFEWFPGIPIYHSRDMKHWELYAHVLTDEKRCDLTKLPSAKGIWAPCLTYCEEEDLFYVIYGVMNSMNARYFDVDNYLVTAKDVRGPWSEPVYLHSAGFDASILHDTDGRKYIVSLEWETRSDYEKPGPICLVEYDPKAKKVTGYPKRIWRGATQRGCLEGPHLTKRGEYYYLMCAEGGTGYYHSVTMARSKNVRGPYEADPANPIVTAVPENHDERADTDHLKPHYYNPENYLQKCGHGSYVETSLGEVYLAHLCARPFMPELRCTLGRETALQKMVWTEDGWLHIADGGNLARATFSGSALPDWEGMKLPERDDFDDEELSICYYAPRISPASFCDLKARPGWLRMRGQESGASLNRVSLLARKLTGVNAEVVTKLDFTPEIPQQSAGLILYYDNMNFVYLRKFYSESMDAPVLGILRLNNGEKTELASTKTLAPKGDVFMKLRVKGRESQFSWSTDGKEWIKIGPAFDTSEFSDEYSNYGEFTGTFVGLTCADRMLHEKCADFDFFEYRDKEPELLIGAKTSNREGVYADDMQRELRKQVQSLRAAWQDEERQHNSYAQEVREQECVRTGDLEGLKKAIEELEMEKVGVLSLDPVRNMQDLAIVVVTLSCRSAIAGGVSPEVAFSMSDVFIREIESHDTYEELLAFSRKAEYEFCLAVREKNRADTDHPLVLRCRDLVNKKIHQKIKVTDLAEKMNVSADYLSEVFSREEGVSLSDYISREKARAAAREILYTDKSFGDIAASLNYSSQSHFGKSFKKWTGRTPKQYRDLYGIHDE